ncbi:MAG: 50S ribosomal protein L29, partial [Deltaproteobacteria bacterium]
MRLRAFRKRSPRRPSRWQPINFPSALRFFRGKCLMKIKEIRDLSMDELQQKNRELVEDYFKLRLRHASGQLDSPATLGHVRRDIAR